LDERTSSGASAEEEHALRCCQQDPLCQVLLGRWHLREPAVALLTLIVGFGVLTTWYLLELAVDPSRRAQRGPFDYYSASIGDLLLLPLLNAAAMRYARQVVGALSLALTTVQSRARRRLAIIARVYNAPLGRAVALSGAAVALILQHLDELYGLDRNWTVPEWGRPRPTAVYHQLFFACEALIVAFLIVRHVATVRLLLRLGRRAASRARLTAVAERSLRLYGWVLLGWGTFVSLRLMDFFHLTRTVSAQALAALPAPVMALAVYYLALIATGLIPMIAVARRYPLARLRAPIVLIGACLVAPVAGPATRILAARLLSV
jgi:hypothetical protein